MNKKFMLIIILLNVSLFAFASYYIYGTSNIGFSGYPSFFKYHPNEPFTLNNECSEYEFNTYRDSVISFVESVETYSENCDYDMKCIVREQELAIEQANKAIEEFNEWADGIIITSKY